MFRQNKIHFTSLGCARNLVDTEVMLGIVLKAGFDITPEIEIADFLIVNTCGFLEASRQEAIDTIEDLFHQKKDEAKIIVAGCMVQKHQRLLQEKFPDIHYFLGSGDTAQILRAVESEEKGKQVTDAKSYLNLGEVPRAISTPRHFAYLKIAEGCKKRCSFCIIPTIKGPLKSKTEEQVLKEFKALLNQGVFEIIFIAQDLGDFGKDRKERGGLESLLTKITAIDQNFWLRLLYLYPDEITDELIEVIQKEKRICPYIDMPIQHINDQILKSMHRKTNRRQIIEVIEKLRREIPDIVIRTSLMVGFPGETEEQFQELVDFIQEFPLDQVGVFIYSKEEDSYSARLPNHIPQAIKEKRFEKLVQTQQKMLKKTLKKYLGQTLSVMIEGFHPQSSYLMRGRFWGQAPDVDGEVIINDGRKVDEFGALYEVKITEILDYDLVGSAVKKLSPTKKLTSSPLVVI